MTYLLLAFFSETVHLRTKEKKLLLWKEYPIFLQNSASIDGKINHITLEILLKPYTSQFTLLCHTPNYFDKPTLLIRYHPHFIYYVELQKKIHYTSIAPNLRWSYRHEIEGNIRKILFNQGSCELILKIIIKMKMGNHWQADFMYPTSQVLVDFKKNLHYILGLPEPNEFHHCSS